MTPPWWHRNRLWVLLLAPLLLAALSVSSFRLVNIYLPWSSEQTRDQLARTVPYRFQQEYTPDRGQVEHHDVEVWLGGVRQTTTAAGALPAPGAILLVVTVNLKAAPTDDLTMCTIELVDAAGRTYGVRAGTVDDPKARFADQPLTCVPEEDPRPEQWQAEAVIAVPADTDLRHVRIWWDRPDAVLLPISR